MRNILINGMTHAPRRPPNKTLPGQTRCGIDFYFNKPAPGGNWSSNFANSRHANSTLKSVGCLWCLFFADMLED